MKLKGLPPCFACGISVTPLDWFKDYLSQRRQRVVLPGVYSNWIFTKAGVPQGSVFGPLNFLVYIKYIVNDIDSNILFFYSVLYPFQDYFTHRDKPIDRWGETEVPRENHLTHPHAELVLSHMWPVRARTYTRHSGENSNIRLFAGNTSVYTIVPNPDMSAKLLLFNNLRDNTILTTLQFEFIPGYLTVNLLTILYNTFWRALDDGKSSLKLKGLPPCFACGISVTPLDWFKDYLSQRRQRVVLPGVYSNWIFTKAGVPQGSVLGPLNFLVYIKYIVNEIDSNIPFLIQFYVPFKIISLIVTSKSICGAKREYPGKTT